MVLLPRFPNWDGKRELEHILALCKYPEAGLAISILRSRTSTVLLARQKIWHDSQQGMDYTRSPSPPAAGRSVDIELGGQEVITIDLDNLDPSPEDVLDLLKEGQCKVWVWTKLAGEYWRRGYLGAAEKIAQQAIDCELSRNIN